MTESHVAVSASGLLAEFNRVGALTWADVHPAQQLGHLFGETDERVRLAIALTVRALRAGSICLELDRLRELDAEADGAAAAVPDDWWPEESAWLDALRASPAVTLGDGPGAERPLRLVDGALYLERHWADQETVRRALLARLATAPASGHPEGQDAAIALALSSPVSVIAGGPGVGKTYTIRRIIEQLRDDQPDALVALAAPTGKAAARMTESLGDGSLTALTLHKLLDKLPGSMSRFRHRADNPLPHDVVIVDEMSMVSMVMMSRLLLALKPSARLIMVGDPDQLSSVDAGSVLADITRAPAASGIVARLTRNYRFSGAIADLANAIRTGDAETACALLRAGQGVTLVSAGDGPALVAERVVATGARLHAAASAGDAAGALAALDAHRLLCGHRRGPYGVAHWTHQVQTWLVDGVPGYSVDGEFPVGRPVMVTSNRPEFGLHNGDTGVILVDDGRPMAWFGVGGQLTSFSPFLLDGLTSVHATTVHKAQGSQFDEVSVILPPPGSPLLTRELLYTAASRARNGVVLLGDEDAVVEAIANPARRMSRLAQRLA